MAVWPVVWTHFLKGDSMIPFKLFFKPLFVWGLLGVNEGGSCMVAYTRNHRYIHSLYFCSFTTLACLDIEYSHSRWYAIQQLINKIHAYSAKIFWRFLIVFYQITAVHLPYASKNLKIWKMTWNRYGCAYAQWIFHRILSITMLLH